MAADILTLDPRWRRSFRALTPEVKAAVRLTLKEVFPSRKDAGKRSLTIVFSNDTEVQKLNAQFRRKVAPTNVLAFPGDEDGYLGDVILAYQTVKSEAAAQSKSFRAHTLHLVVHGVLHILGYDHAGEKAAKRMEKLEIKILSRIAIANPYEAE
ncbi:MAG: rRNA maturation RNase YbeY [Alphaproteobacteria bacterium]